MAGDLTEEGEQKLMDKLNAKKEELKSLRKAHDALEKEFNQLDEDFAEVRKVTGVNSSGGGRREDQEAEGEQETIGA